MKTEILRLLRSTDEYVSGQELCNRFDVSRTAVWKVINQLKEAGYEIESVSKKGYRLVAAPDVMDESEILSRLDTAWAGKNYCFFPEIDSTNARAKELAEAGAPHGTFVVADRQTAGKGRRGRSWDSPSGTGIFMTILLRPDFAPNVASMVTLVAALATEKAVEEVVSKAVAGSDCKVPEIGIKWPNDLVINGKKICGILTEMSIQSDYIDNVVIGIGINVHNDSFPEEIRETATSMMLECKTSFRRADIIVAFLKYFEKYYEMFVEKEDLTLLLPEYNSLLVNMNRGVKVLDPKEPFSGVARGINEKGELLVERENTGDIVPVGSGEVSVRGIYGYT